MCATPSLWPHLTCGRWCSAPSQSQRRRDDGDDVEGEKRQQREKTDEGRSPLLFTRTWPSRRARPWPAPPAMDAAEGALDSPLPRHRELLRAQIPQRTRSASKSPPRGVSCVRISTGPRCASPRPLASCRSSAGEIRRPRKTRRPLPRS
jgi:hypothetical protein